ncbi:myo-inositol catabolism protein [Faecalicatena contorta]|uniref:5-deoxy-glucuronate isomerase n=1 Tax=Faecalicatena contorta TaxID=39482 RepID=UPI00129E5852|nr:5-deoxy-glucuronate isomerase [Faecalicatena contorta]MRM86900.1 myo-inositol catabolism protein [Faecalicatena contorta]
MQNIENKERMEGWKVQSSDENGFHKVITPDTCECKEAQMFRLNLPAGESYILESGELEMHPVLLKGKARLSGHKELNQEMEKFDSCYIPGDEYLTITAEEDCIFYIAGAKYEGIGEPHFRKFDISLPIGEVHQIHGEGVGQREVMFTLAPQDSASKLICGLTWSGEGAWTSWPPHQHEKDLEEIYCYFDMSLPKFGFHISYLKSGEVEDIVAHTVYSGTMVQAPCGYHPTVASPGSRNAYLWVLAAFTQESRSYDLAINDPVFDH